MGSISMTDERATSSQPTPRERAALGPDDVIDSLRGLRYGQVTVTIHDGVIVQIDRTERKRGGDSKNRRS